MTAAAHPIDTSTPVLVLAPAVRLGVGHGIARSLGRLGIPVFGVHGDLRAAAARSRYWRRNFEWDFAGSPPGRTLEALLAFGRQIGGRPLLVPADDSTCLLVDDHAAALRERFHFPEQPEGLVRRLSSKRSMFELCVEMGIPTPKTLFPRSRADVLEVAGSLRYPAMLKGIDTFALYLRTGVRMVVARSRDHLLEQYDRLEDPKTPNLMIQEHIPGNSDSVWMFDGYFDAASRCRFGITGRKLRQYPADKGVTSLGMCVDNPAVFARTVDLMRSLGYRGILDIGYKRDPATGEYLLLDVNPRIGVSFRLFVDRGGMDVARALYLDLTGQEVPAGAAPEGRRWIVENFDAVTAFQYLRSGRLGWREYLRSLAGVEEASWYARDDLRPALAMVRASLGWGGETALAAGRRRLSRPAADGHALDPGPSEVPARDPAA